MGKFATAAPFALVFIVAIGLDFVSGINKVNRMAKRASRQQAADVYTASWAVEIVDGGKEMADLIASRYGYINLGTLKEVGIEHFFLSLI